VHTEGFHLRWLEKYHGFSFTMRDMHQRHGEHPFLTANLDGWCANHETFVDAKHSNARANRESMVEWYQPQIAHYCNVVGKDSGWLSYIAGNAAPDFFEIEPSIAYRKQLLDAELAFWWHVTEDTEPYIETPIDTTLAAEVKIDAMRVVDMTGNNQWADLADVFIDNKLPAAAFEQAKAGLKKLVDADVRIASGHGISIKRSKSGSLLISEGL
jgi:predicted phage-related endonuclease